jgi:hypothetical protein
MSLVWHIFKKDIRRFRYPIAYGLLIAALQPFFGLLDVLLASKDIQLHTALLKLVFLGAWGQTFTTILLTAILTGITGGEETLVSTTAFWLTRPISPATLLKAKALFLGIFLVLVPVLSQSLLLALEGVTAGDIGYAGLEMAFRLAESIVLAWGLASLTPSTGRFLIAAALVFPLQWLAGWWMLFWKDFLNAKADPPFMATELMVTDSIVIAALTILGGTILIIRQYQMRDTRRTVYAGLAMLALLFLVQPLWRWDLQKPAVPAGTGDSIGVTLGKYRVGRDSLGWSNPRPTMGYWGDLEFTGRQPGEEFRALSISPTLVLPDGKTFSNGSSALGSEYVWNNDPNSQVAQEALTPLRLLNKDRFQPNGDYLLRLDPQIYQRFLDRPVTYRADLDLLRIRYKLEGEIPLTIGAGFRQGSNAVTLLEVSPVSSGFQVKLQDQGLDLAFNRDPRTKRVVFYTEDGVFYALVNKKLGEAYLPEPHSQNIRVDLHQAKQALRVQQETLEFVSDPGGPLKEGHLDKDWIKDAILVRVRMEPVEEFHKKLEVGDFSLVENGRRSPQFHNRTLWYSLEVPTIEPDLSQGDWNSLPQVQGKKLESSSRILLLDDFEKGGGPNCLGAYWYDQCDKNNLGTVINPSPLKPQPGGCPASPKFAARIWGHFGKEQYPWPFANMGCGFDPKYDYVDLKNFSAFRFWTKGDGRPYLLMVERASITDYGYYQSGFTAHKDWTQVTLPLSGFYQPGWAKPVPMGWADVRQFQFSPDPGVFSDDDFDLWVDDIELVK